MISMFSENLLYGWRIDDPWRFKSKKFEVKKFETIENSKHEEREEELIRLRWTSRLEKEAENIANILSKSDSKREDVLKLPKLVHANKRDIQYRVGHQ
jgi:hypothetical protein